MGECDQVLTFLLGELFSQVCEELKKGTLPSRKTILIARIIILKVTFSILVIFCFIALLGSGISEMMETSPRDPVAFGKKYAAEVFPRYYVPILGGSLAVSVCVAFGDVLFQRRPKQALLTFSDEEFVSRFGGKST